MSSFNSALASGLALGTRVGNDRQEQELALARLRLAAEQFRARTAIDQGELDLRRDQFNTNRKAYDTAQAQQTADRASMGREYHQSVTRPRLAEAAGRTDFGRDHGAALLDEAQSAQQDEEAFGQSSAGRMEDVLRGPREINTKRMAAEIAQMAADRRLRDQIIAIENLGSGFPKEAKEALILQAKGVHIEALKNLPMSQSDYVASPGWQTMDPELQSPALAWFNATGEPPNDEWMRNQKERLKQQRTPPTPTVTPKDNYGLVEKEYEHALAALTAEEARLKNDLVEPKGKKPTDPAWATWNAANRRIAPFRQRLRDMEARRRSAFDQTQQPQTPAATGAGPQAAPTAAARPTPQLNANPEAIAAATDRAQQMFPDWMTNPEAEARMEAMIRQMLSGEQAIDDPTAVPIR